MPTNYQTYIPSTLLICGEAMSKFVSHKSPAAMTKQDQCGSLEFLYALDE